MTPDKFLAAIRYFGDPKIPDGADAEVILEAYRESLGRYSEDVLKLAAKRMLESRKHRNFPLPEECVRYCRDAQEEIAIQREREAEAAGKARVALAGNPWSEARVHAANSMMNSEIGRLSAQEEWIVHLHDFCRECQRLPNHLESERVRREGLGIKAERERLANSASTAAGLKIIASVARTMDAKRKRLVALAFGRDAG